jgi:hypothetical protein
MQQIEGIEDDAMGLGSYDRVKRLEVRTAIAILDYSLTINDCRLAVETSSSADDAGIAVAPIISIPAKDTHLAAINHHLGAVAIVFDFVNPVLALWRLIGWGSKLRLDEPETGADAKHWGLVGGVRPGTAARERCFNE